MGSYELTFYFDVIIMTFYSLGFDLQEQNIRMSHNCISNFIEDTSVFDGAGLT